MTGWRSACDSSACVAVKYVTACGGGECVEVHGDGDRVLVRNSTKPEIVVEFTREEWLTFLDGVRRGEFDVG